MKKLIKFVPQGEKGHFFPLGPKGNLFPKEKKIFYHLSMKEETLFHKVRKILPRAKSSHFTAQG